MCGWTRRHTLGALEDASLAASGQSLVEVGGKHGIGNTAEVVVGKNIFLDSLATVKSCQQTILGGRGSQMPLDQQMPEQAVGAMLY